jgi:hypothetical protein
MTDEAEYKLRAKPITTARKAPDEQQVRDTFWTPNYAVDLLIPFIPKHITHVWECATGGRKISGQLLNSGYTVLETDIKEMENVTPYNFISDTKRTDIKPGYFSIITNPPFSIKDLFVEKCFEYEVPFALLINADYSGKTIDWIRRGCEKLIPTSRIAYITPNILRRIHEGETWKEVHGDAGYGSTQRDMENYKAECPNFWKDRLAFYDKYLYKTIEEAPSEMLYRYSNAQFHSMWLTYGFGLGRTETFVDLSVQQRHNI